MYSEDKIINGILMTRSSPNGEWRPKNGLPALALNLLWLLSEEERDEIFGYFCRHCGSVNRSCRCWDDS